MAEEQLKARAVAAEREQEDDDDEDEEDDGMYEGERLRKGWERKISSTTGDVYYYCEVRPGQGCDHRFALQLTFELLCR